MIWQARGILEQRVEEDVNIRELALSLGFGYHQFRRTFKELTGFAPYQYHLQLRIDRAKQLLSKTELSIKEIAALLKFDNSCHFSKMFKRYAGTSPTDWRNVVHSRDQEK